MLISKFTVITSVSLDFQLNVQIRQSELSIQFSDTHWHFQNVTCFFSFPLWMMKKNKTKNGNAQPFMPSAHWKWTIKHFRSEWAINECGAEVGGCIYQFAFSQLIFLVMLMHLHHEYVFVHAYDLRHSHEWTVISNNNNLLKITNARAGVNNLPPSESHVTPFLCV